MDHLTPDLTAKPLEHIVVCGSGLAAQMTVAALSRQVPARMRLTWLKVAGTDSHDVLYNGVTSPAAYDFNLGLGVDEPSLVLTSDTAFSYGTKYTQWGRGKRTWIQAFQAPFPVLEGVLLYHYFLQRGLSDISPYLVAALAARSGVFAHPPEDQRHPLAHAEYGYQFDAASYGALFERAIGPDVTVICADLAGIDRQGEVIGALRLSDGQTLSGDLFIDCTGPAALLASLPNTNVSVRRTLGFMNSRSASSPLGPPVRTVTAARYGWTATTPILGANLSLTVFAPEDEGEAATAHGDAAHKGTFDLGYRPAAWTGNCVAIGHAAGMLEPLTPAPYAALQRDIERVASLLPNSVKMAVERREYNRQYSDDYRHADMFNQALFDVDDAHATPYWQQAVSLPRDERLAAKIEQFESRGLNVAYDLEPFGVEDWIILHFGMGRRAQRYDRIADHVPFEKTDAYLSRLRSDIATSVNAMPTHARYRDGLAAYLKQQTA